MEKHFTVRYRLNLGNGLVSKMHEENITMQHGVSTFDIERMYYAKFGKENISTIFVIQRP